MRRELREAALLAALVGAFGCGWQPPDPKAEGHEMPIEITEEDPVNSPGVGATSGQKP